MLSLLALAATTQTKTPQGDAAVLQALSDLRQKGAITLQMSGQIEIGVKPVAKTEAIQCDATWVESVKTPLNTVQSEVLEYRGNQLKTRLVADGENVWNYNLDAREYQAGHYTFYTNPIGTRQNSSVDRALELLRLDANHVGTYATRLLEQTYSGTTATFQTWLPGAKVETVPDPQVQDIIDVIYTLGTPTKKQITFKLLSSDSTLKLSSIEYSNTVTANGEQRTVSWTMTPSTYEPGKSNFKPYPGGSTANWKVVANSG